MRKYAPRCSMEILNTLSHVSAVKDQIISFDKRFIGGLLCNLNSKNGHVNGTRFVKENMINNFLFIRIATDMQKVSKLTVLRITCTPGNDSFRVLCFKCLRFPTRLCFAKRTTRAQGQSFGQKKESVLARTAFVMVICRWRRQEPLILQISQ